MSNTFYHGRYSVTNEQWKIIEPHLPKSKSTGRPCLNPRTVFNAILWILGSGAAWRDLPTEYGNWNSIYHKFRQWLEQGVFERILQSIVSECQNYYLIEIDSTFCKVHQHAAGARKILGNQNIGVSRGGKTTKIHALVNEYFQLVALELSSGNLHDSEMAIKLLSKITLVGKKVLADKAFCSEEIRDFIFQQKAVACIPDKSNAVRRHDFDHELYKSRNIIERFCQRIKNFRHIATRYDKLSICFLNFVTLAAVQIQI
ncbi:MAG: IS5 family transposase [Selenomonadaceae bacterium]|nr:IS5 family transposase [Selenomonadaceae bacterium]